MADITGKDQYQEIVIQGVSSVDNSTPINIQVDPSTHKLQVDASVSIDTTGLATDSNQTDGSQKTQIVDAGGEAVTVTGGKLDVSLAGQSIPATSATEAVSVQIVDGSGNQITSFGGGTQYTEGDTDATLTGTVAMVEGAANAVAPMTQPLTDTQLRASDVKITLDSESVAVTNSGITTIAGAVSGTEMQVDVLTMPTITVNSHEVTNAGVFSVQESGGSLTALQLIDDVVTSQGTALGSTKTVLQGASVTTAAPTYTTGQISPLNLATTGALRVDIGATSANATAVKVNVASGGIAAGAIAAGNTSIATTEDTARAGGEHLVKIGLSRLDTPVSNANVSNDGDYTNFIADNFGKLWVSGSVPEDTAHVAGEAISQNGVRRIDTAATSAGSSGDWATMDASAEGALWATLTPTTTSGLSVANFNTGDTYTALTNSAQVIKASAGNLYGYYIMNPNSSTAYVLVYNVAAASVTVGTTTALMVFAVPSGAAANLMFPYPVSFSSAMSCAAATTGGGNSAPSTALEVMFWYK